MTTILPSDAPTWHTRLCASPPAIQPGVLRRLDAARAAAYWGWPAAEFDALRFDGATGLDAYIGLLELARQRDALPRFVPRSLAALHKETAVPQYEVAARVGTSRPYYCRVAGSEALLAAWTPRVLVGFWLVLHGTPVEVTLPRKALDGALAARATEALREALDRPRSQTELAEELYVTLTTIKRWSTHGVPASHAQRVLDALDRVGARTVPSLLEGVADAPELEMAQ